jgi:hypothetical protein
MRDEREIVRREPPGSLFMRGLCARITGGDQRLMSFLCALEGEKRENGIPGAVGDV